MNVANLNLKAWGIKRLGNRVMYIPINDSELYIVPEILFHYFYVHKMLPAQKFRDAVFPTKTRK